VWRAAEQDVCALLIDEIVRVHPFDDAHQTTLSVDKVVKKTVRIVGMLVSPSSSITYLLL
jgi:hypothetical protein